MFTYRCKVFDNSCGTGPSCCNFPLKQTAAYGAIVAKLRVAFAIDRFCQTTRRDYGVFFDRLLMTKPSWVRICSNESILAIDLVVSIEVARDATGVTFPVSIKVRMTRNYAGLDKASVWTIVVDS